MKTILKDGSACHHCGKVVARNRKNSLGKGRVKHLCPHGNDCGTGDYRFATNNAARCVKCRRRQQDIEAAKLN